MSIESNAKFAATNLFDVEGWTVIVTGGSTGIGLMIAQTFANNGARVYILGRRTEALQSVVATWSQSLFHPKGSIIGVRADVTNKEEIQKVVDEIGKKEGRVDVLVNNAGTTKNPEGASEELKGVREVKEMLWKQKVEDWEEVYRTNVIG